MLHSISDLTTFCRKTTGDVPPKLVGASTTVVGSKMYLFGGRLVTERRMVSDLYMFDLETLHWTKVPAFQDDDTPRARYFHSADTWNNQLVIFGGMSNKLESINPDDLCVLNDVRFFDLSTNRWTSSSSSNSQLATLPPPTHPDATESMDPESLIPRARYAHLSSVTGDRLFIIGGQDFFNVWLDDVCIYDLGSQMWVQRREYPRHCGTYRSVAVSSNMVVRIPQEDERQKNVSILGPSGARFAATGTAVQNVTPSDSLTHLPYSVPATPESPSDIYLYSNYNFTDVKRELEVFSPQPRSASNVSASSFTISDRSNSMKGSSFPPGLRFPTGAILGTHFIIAGTYLAHTYQSFSIWALDLVTMTWSRIDPGNAVSTGSWARGCLYAEANKFLIFGNRNGSLVDDYTRRLLSWDHVAVVDLEAFGIYQAPRLQIDIPMQELGLAALEESVTTDFEIVCDDGRTIPCSRRILEARWPWFKEQRRKFVQIAVQTIEQLPPQDAAPFLNSPLPSLPGVPADGEDRPDPRLTPRALRLSEPYPITLALLQYFYSAALLTPLQHAPAVLSQLLVLSATYDIMHLETLVKHAMHRALSNSTSVGVYEVATLCSCRSLQIRALKTVMSYSQKRPSRSRQDKDADGDGGRSNRQGGGPDSNQPSISRPRGTSDAYWRQPSAPGSSNSGGTGPARGYGQRAVGNGKFDPEEELHKLLRATGTMDDSQVGLTFSPKRSAAGSHGPLRRPMTSPSSPSSSSGSVPATTYGFLRPEIIMGKQPLRRQVSVCTIVDGELCAVAELMSSDVSHEDDDVTSFASPSLPSPSLSRKPSTSSYSHASPSHEKLSIAQILTSEFSPIPNEVSGDSEFEGDGYSPCSDDSHQPGFGALLDRPRNPMSRRTSDASSSFASTISSNSPSSSQQSPTTPHFASHIGIEVALANCSIGEEPGLDTYNGTSLYDSTSHYSLEAESYTSTRPSLPKLDIRPVSSSPPSSPIFSASVVSFARFFGGQKDDNRMHRGDATPITSPTFLTTDPKLAKKRKKEEARIRTERLAHDLKMRRKARAETASTYSDEKKNKTADVAVMYGSNYGLLGI